MIRRILSLLLLLTACGSIFAAIREETLTRGLAWIVLATWRVRLNRGSVFCVFRVICG